MDEPCDVVSLFPSSFVAFVAGLKHGFASNERKQPTVANLPLLSF